MRVIKHEQAQLGMPARKTVAREAFGSIQRTSNAIKHPDPRKRLRLLIGENEPGPQRGNRNVAEIRKVEAKHHHEEKEMKLVEPPLSPHRHPQQKRQKIIRDVRKLKDFSQNRRAHLLEPNRGMYAEHSMVDGGQFPIEIALVNERYEVSQLLVRERDQHDRVPLMHQAGKTAP